MRQQIDWETGDSHILINPRYSLEEQRHFQKILEKASSWPGHIWLSTSGSTVKKWVGLSKKAILASARAVNDHLSSNYQDKWIQALPEFHVGGLGIWARSYLSGASVADFKASCQGKWEAFAFHHFIQETKGTLTALVPAQLHDLIQLNLTAPPSLRATIIGGGKISSELYQKAQKLKWKVLPSYGLTECASQVATTEMGTEKAHLKLLSHIQAKVQEDGRLSFKGESLFSVYAFCHAGKVEFMNPKVEGWFVTEDMGTVDKGVLNVFGRVDQMIKVGGESVNVDALEIFLQNIKMNKQISTDMTLLAVPDSRLGHSIHLVVATSSKESMQEIIDQFQQTVLPFERIRHVHYVLDIPRSALSKVLKQELLANLNLSTLSS